MITFLDGPAAGKTLGLRRAPRFLRVVHDPGFKAVCKKGRAEWDALDQLDDEPRSGETVYVYRCVESRGMVHLNMGRKGGSGYYAMASYAHVAEQPDESVTRNTAKWREWCTSQAKGAEEPKE